MANSLTSAIYALLLLLLVSVLISARVNSTRGQKNPAFIFLCLLVICWILADFAILLIFDVSINIYVWSIVNIFVATAPLAFFLVTFGHFFPERKLPKYAIVLMSIIPAITSLLALFPHSHTLFRNVESVNVWPRAVEYSMGAWFIPHTISSYTLTISSGLIVLIYGVIKNVKSDPVAAKLYFAGTVATGVGSFAYMLDVLSSDINPTSIGFSISVILIHLSISDNRFNLNFRMFNTFRSRITFPSLIGMFIVFSVMIFIVGITTRSLMDDFEYERFVSTKQSISAYFTSQEQIARNTAFAIGGNAELINLMNAGNRDDIWQFTYDNKHLFGVDEVIISSANGYTIARSHIREFYNDNISEASSIAAALQGNFLTFYTSTPTASMVMTSTAPILDGDSLIGIVVVNFVIGRDVFIDRVKDIFGADIAVYNHEGVSVSSTLICPDSNMRAIDGFAPADITEEVLRRGQSIHLELNVLGEQYLTYYLPLPGVDGNPNAMLFIGISRDEANTTIGMSMRNIIIVCTMGAAVISIIMFFLIIKALKPLDTLTKNVKDVSEGNMNTNIDLKIITPDEIGSLAQDVCGLVDVIKSMVDDISVFSNEVNIKGDIEYRIDSTKYRGEYNHMIESLNDFTDGFVKDIHAVLGALSNVNNGDFKARTSKTAR